MTKHIIKGLIRFSDVCDFAMDKLIAPAMTVFLVSGMVYYAIIKLAEILDMGMRP